MLLRPVALVPLLASMGCVRNAGPVVSLSDQDAVRREVASFRDYALTRARIPPPSIPYEERVVDTGRFVVTVRPARPEDEPWNRWVDGAARLFNNRMAHLVHVRVEGEGPVAWDPDHTTLELNDASTRLTAAASPELVLRDLLVLALQQEQVLLDGGLVDRTRAAGPFRAAYLPLAGDGVLEGVVAFPLNHPDPEVRAGLADLHVVAVRVTLTVLDAAGSSHRVVVVYE